MEKKKRILVWSVLAVALSLTGMTVANAADHIDSPAAVAEPTADITDLFAWMSDDASDVNLILDVNPFADGTAAFSPAVQYVFHVNSGDSFLSTPTQSEVICQFENSTSVGCWVVAADGTVLDYVSGDPSSAAGIESDSGMVRVYAGLRDDPFFMEFTGFTETVSTVVSVAGTLSFDGAGCPDLDMATSDALVGQLQSGEAGAPASDTFAGSNVLAIVVSLDKTLVNGGGDTLNVWASTHAAP